MPLSISPISALHATPVVVETRQTTGHPPAHDQTELRHPHAHPGAPSGEADEEAPDLTASDAVIGTIVDVRA
jgi:hypothetical protein